MFYLMIISNARFPWMLTFHFIESFIIFLILDGVANCFLAEMQFDANFYIQSILCVK